MSDKELFKGVIGDFKRNIDGVLYEYYSFSDCGEVYWCIKIEGESFGSAKAAKRMTRRDVMNLFS